MGGGTGCIFAVGKLAITGQLAVHGLDGREGDEV